MKLKILFSLFLLSAVYCKAQYNWQSLPNAPKSWRCDDFYFLNPSLGWALHPYYTGPFMGYPLFDQYGQIYKTTDGGNTWQLVKDSATTFFRSIGFADAQTGWAGNLGLFFGSPDSNILYQTNDGGLTWNPAHIPYPHPQGVCGISVVTDSVVYAYGTFYGPAGYLKTTDKGATWNFKKMSAYAKGLVDGYFFNRDTGFVTGQDSNDHAIILYTNDGGSTWSYSYHSTRSNTDIVWKLSFPGSNIAYASVEPLGVSPNTVFLKTTDRGATWTEHPFIPSYDEEGIGFINDSVGWLGGDNVKPTYKTTDGGNTWNIDEGFGVLTPPYHDYDGVYFPGFAINRFRKFGDTLMYASGNTVYKLNVGTTSVTQISNRNPALLSNYPNPFNNETTITYLLDAAADNVIIEVYGTMSGIAYSKSLGAKDKGEHQYIFKEHLPSGLYYYSILNGNSRSTKKMVVIH